MSGQLAQLPLDWGHFLAHYWQREPLLIRQALPQWSPPIDADTLAGLALEEDVESRIIEHREGAWYLEHGPFNAEAFDRQTQWTLLVQAVDHYIPAVAALKSLFSAIPSWRADDVMVSYATHGGSVGPHYDNYDVFLLQGDGHRRWQLGQRCDTASEHIPHEALRILQHFDREAEYLLAPGDMLYVPPGVAHWGVAEGECTTFSIGFRAPRAQDMLSRRVDAQLEAFPLDRFFTDAQSTPAALAGEIRAEDRARVAAQLSEVFSKFTDDTWFGELVTEPRYPPEQQIDEPLLLDAAVKAVVVPAQSRVAWQREPGGSIRAFANGESACFPDTVLECLVQLCAGEALEQQALQDHLGNMQTKGLLEWLLRCGCVDVE